MIEHHIQKDILIRLSKAEYLRFSQLKPTDMESNIFMYHLKQLKALKLVDKSEHGYELSNAGLAYIDGFSFHTLKPRKQPKLISILAVRNERGEWLMAKRKYQPYIGQYMFVSGKQHLGEDPTEHANREVREKLNMDIPISRKGMSDIRIYRDDFLITHVTAHIYEGASNSDYLPPSNNQFEFAWISPETNDHKLLAGTQEIIDKITSSEDPFFLSLNVQDE